ncbi:glycogen synthase [Mangrovimonas sp. YM274]|uniref:glycogen synthase n=1 Tax=Mangrovimonas sp. YM274 TaxID=3070660 RepID=UPI0027DE1952|nr:glycogen/starch synthase [Mangrovimonas sp. YM274]WMI67976.1 glycogen/starch synthase [Mangrovimonas sp. YM274]
MHSNFLFVSAENDAIKNCKAGGMGDVVRDVPRQIAAFGDWAHVVTPAYNRLHVNGEKLTELHFSYRGNIEMAEVYKVAPKKDFNNITHYVIHHPEIVSGNIAHIYFNDPEQPFYTDACMFSLFCIAVAQAIKQDVFGHLDVVHLHDWHSSLLLFLRAYHPAYGFLNNIRFVYSIHNLAIQGIRPFEGSRSSLKAFYPEVEFDYDRLKDPRYHDCINLMALGIKFANAVHTVSPSYKEDIMNPSDFPNFIGGEGLEGILREANEEKRLFGILNGCNYKNINLVPHGAFYVNAIQAIFEWLQEPEKEYKANFLIHTGEKIVKLIKDPAKFVCASVARLTEQKFYFYKNSPELLVTILEKLKEVNGIYAVLGTGAPEYEELLHKISYEHENFIFFNGQSEEVIDSIYTESNLYLMPSLFEPCGISQMLAMRNAQPCLVHHTGGLKDTVKHMETGFAFDGATIDEKTQNFIQVFQEALSVFFKDKQKWDDICLNAKSQKFTWKSSVIEYYKKLYRLEVKMKNYKD